MTIAEVHVIEANDGLGIAEIIAKVDFTAHVQYETHVPVSPNREDDRTLETQVIETNINDIGKAVMTVEFAYNEDRPYGRYPTSLDRPTHAVRIVAHSAPSF